MREEYQQKLQAKLDEWKAEIDKLKAKAEGAEADARVEYLQQVERLKLKRDELAVRLKTLKQQSGSAWDEVRAGIDTAWDELSEAVKRAWESFR